MLLGLLRAWLLDGSREDDLHLPAHRLGATILFVRGGLVGECEF